MKINYIYDIDSEVDYLRDLSTRAGFFRNNKYRVIVPKGLGLDIIYNMELGELRNAVEKELDNNLADKMACTLGKEIISHEKEFIAYLDNLPVEKPLSIKVFWTKYGPGGSYYEPGRVRLRFDASVPVFVNFLQEVTHSIIEESIVKKYALNHAEKESIVDFLTIKMIPQWKYTSIGPPSAGLLRRLGLK